MTQERIQVTIIDNSQGSHCAECYAPGGSAANVAFVVERLKARFGDSVAIEYIDLALVEDNEPNIGSLASVEAKGAPLPIIAINGVPRLSGAIAYRPIAEAIDTMREVSFG